MPEKKKRIRREKEESIVNQIVTTSKKEVPKPKLLTLLPSGATVYDCALGGGIPNHAIYNIVGDSATFKTYLAIEQIFRAKQVFGDKLKWFFDDIEERNTFNTKKLYGFNLFRKNQKNSYTIEDFSNNFKKEIKGLAKDEFLIYVLDSFDALTSEAELEYMEKREKGSETGSYNLDKQKYLGGFFRTKKKLIKNNNCILVVISQVRVNIGVSFGKQYYRTGGKALDHWADIISWLAVSQKHEKKDRVIGGAIKAQITKVGNDKPFRIAFIDFITDYGVDDIKSNLLFLYDLRTKEGKLKKKVIKKRTVDKEKNKNDNLIWDDLEFETLDSLLKHIEDKNLEEELKRRVKEKWGAIEESISSKDRKRKF